MSKITGYKLVRSTPATLDQAVQGFIGEGWQPFGSPFVTDYMSPTCTSVSVFQAMVRYEEQPGSPVLLKDFELLRRSMQASIGRGARCPACGEYRWVEHEDGTGHCTACSHRTLNTPPGTVAKL